MEHQEIVIIVDFGGQYAQLIARRVRECGVYCEILPYVKSADEILAKNPKAIILSGGPSSVNAPDAPKIDNKIFEAGIPVLGICYGMQLICNELGGKVARPAKREYGHAMFYLDGENSLFDGLSKESAVWMSHGDSVVEMPKGFSLAGHTDLTPTAAVANEERKMYAVQFHPEVVHTEEGTALLKNFLFKIARCDGGWSMENYVDIAGQNIREQVGSDNVICALSGGVDSSVAAVLVHKAIGDQLTCVFVDHGFLRLGEAEQVVDTFTNKFNMKLVHVDASKHFMDLLSGVTEPEKKRKTIGAEFINTFQREANKLSNVKFLVQGTLYPDVVESGTATAATIKSHHNVGGLPKDMKFKLIEPLRELFKDEVRQLGRELGLPEEVINRQPFPGPGLAIRIIGDITPERLDILRKADFIVRDVIKQHGLYNDIWQSFAVLPAAIRSVGVQGDERTYDYTVGIRAVTSSDGMTADYFRFPWEVLDEMSRRICNEVKGVNRVVYDITSKPPSTIEWE
ncbi:glutamine-hydrolyzing GMP synthase [Dialister pneumosintes]|uniref:GMP synthase [glutamine-hydrolyzing] n=1 Tax=Dialister pneumosintes TaxID=39950 RepID=A0A1B3WE15_9FIRM|nr:glutamine-hydrolyzing GMP synthase [Dialister pneumosintes]AOH39196.1 glutamine-hydrolyzing GMP synthase [Dialister pneumosintes]